MSDQRGIMRGYVKYDNEIRTGKNVKQVVHRALQIAQSEPAGPVYLTSPREIMERGRAVPERTDPAATARWTRRRSPRNSPRRSPLPSPPRGTR